jgi:hypothetical protein
MRPRIFSIVSVLVVLSLQATVAVSKEIPRKPGGVPDLSGLYTMGPFSAVAPTVAPDPFARGSLAAVQLPSRDTTLFAFEADAAVR